MNSLTVQVRSPSGRGQSGAGNNGQKKTKESNKQTNASTPGISDKKPKLTIVRQKSIENLHTQPRIVQFVEVEGGTTVHGKNVRSNLKNQPTSPLILESRVKFGKQKLPKNETAREYKSVNPSTNQSIDSNDFSIAPRSLISKSNFRSAVMSARKIAECDNSTDTREININIKIVDDSSEEEKVYQAQTRPIANSKVAKRQSYMKLQTVDPSALSRAVPSLKRANTQEGLISLEDGSNTLSKPGADQSYKPTTPRLIPAAAEELTNVVQLFEEKHQQETKVPRAILILQSLSNFSQLVLLQIEHAQLHRIFYLLKPCQQLQACFFAHNEIHTKDITYISSLGRLRKLDLSFNSISFFPEAHYLKGLKYLEFLLLHHNEMVGWSQVQNFAQIKNLRHLTLQGNPCSKITGFRKYLIEMLPNIQCLDEFIVFDFERGDIEKLYPQKMYGRAKQAELKRFKMYNPGFTSWQGYGPPHSKAMIPSDINDDNRSEIVVSESDFQMNQEVATMMHCYNAGMIKNALDLEHYALNRKFEWCSPALTITKTVRSFLVRKFIKRRQRVVKLLFVMLRKWRLRFVFHKFIGKIGLGNPVFRQIVGVVRFIQKCWRQTRQKKLVKTFTALRIQANYRMYAVQNACIEVFIQRNPGHPQDQNLAHTQNQLSTTQQVPQRNQTGYSSCKNFVDGGGGSTQSNNSILKRTTTIAPASSKKINFMSRQSSKYKPTLVKQNSHQGNKIFSPKNVIVTPNTMSAARQFDRQLGITLIPIAESSSDAYLTATQNQNSSTSQGPRLLFCVSQLDICDYIGFANLVASFEQSNEFVLAKLELEDSEWVKKCRSPLHLWIHAAFKMVTLLGLRRQRNKMLKMGSFTLHNTSNMGQEYESKPQTCKAVKTITMSKQTSTESQQSPTRKSAIQRKSTFKDQTPNTGIGHQKYNTSSNHRSVEKSNKKSIESFCEWMQSLNMAKQTPSSQTRGVDSKNALVACSFENDQVVAKVLRMIVTYNRQNPNKRLLVFYEPLLFKLKAAVRIQRWFRHTLHRIKQQRLFASSEFQKLTGPNQKNQAQIAFITRQVIKIQRMIRIWRFRQRILTLEKIADYASKLTSSTLYIEENTYLNLGKIEALSANGKGKLSSLCERNFRYQFDERGMSVMAQFSSKQDVTGRYKHCFLPQWFNKKVECQIPPIEFGQSPGSKFTKIPFYSKKATVNHLTKVETQGFVHYQPHPANALKLPCVMSLSRILDKPVIGKDPRFVCISHASELEARNRAVLLALKTCRYLRNSNIFVRMYTREQLDAQEKVSAQIQALLMQNKLLYETFEKALKTDHQPHGGLIYRHNEPYRTMLRARPKNKNRLERFIVLEDADSVEARKRYEDVMAKNNRRKQIQVELPRLSINQEFMSMPVLSPTAAGSDYLLMLGGEGQIPQSTSQLPAVYSPQAAFTQQLAGGMFVMNGFTSGTQQAQRQTNHGNNLPHYTSKSLRDNMGSFDSVASKFQQQQNGLAAINYVNPIQTMARPSPITKGGYQRFQLRNSRSMKRTISEPLLQKPQTTKTTPMMTERPSYGEQAANNLVRNNVFLTLNGQIDMLAEATSELEESKSKAPVMTQLRLKLDDINKVQVVDNLNVQSLRSVALSQPELIIEDAELQNAGNKNNGVGQIRVVGDFSSCSSSEESYIAVDDKTTTQHGSPERLNQNQPLKQTSVLDQTSLLTSNSLLLLEQSADKHERLSIQQPSNVMIKQTSLIQKLQTTNPFADRGFANQTNKVSGERNPKVQPEPPINLSSQQPKNKTTPLFLEYEKNKDQIFAGFYPKLKSNLGKNRSSSNITGQKSFEDKPNRNTRAEQLYEQPNNSQQLNSATFKPVIPITANVQHSYNKTARQSSLIKRINDVLKHIDTDEGLYRKQDKSSVNKKKAQALILKSQIHQTTQLAIGKVSPVLPRGLGLPNVKTDDQSGKQNLRTITSEPQLMTIKNFQKLQEARGNPLVPQQPIGSEIRLVQSSRKIQQDAGKISSQQMRGDPEPRKVRMQQTETKQFGSIAQPFFQSLGASNDSIQIEGQSENETIGILSSSIQIHPRVRISKTAKAIKREQTAKRSVSPKVVQDILDQGITQVSLPALNQEYYSTAYRRLIQKDKGTDGKRTMYEDIAELQQSEAKSKENKRICSNLQPQTERISNSNGKQQEGLQPMAPEYQTYEQGVNTDLVEAKLRKLKEKKARQMSALGSIALKQKHIQLELGSGTGPLFSTIAPSSALNSRPSRIVSIGSFCEPKMLRSNHFALHAQLQNRQEFRETINFNQKHRRIVNPAAGNGILQAEQIAPRNKGSKYSLLNNDSARLRVLSPAQKKIFEKKGAAAQMLIPKEGGSSTKKIIIDVNAKTRV